MWGRTTASARSITVRNVSAERIGAGHDLIRRRTLLLDTSEMDGATAISAAVGLAERRI
jgi:hypothetical protein